MYLSKITIENFRFFGEGPRRLEIPLRPGLTALVGENDAGKTALVDALRLALGTTDQDWFRLRDTDFHGADTTRQIKIACRFDNLDIREMATFAEHLSYGAHVGDNPFLVVNWSARDTGLERHGRPYRRIDIRSGREGSGPRIDSEVRESLRATYLRPLRDAEQALSAGRGSRLSRVLRYSKRISSGADEHDPETPLEAQDLSVVGIGNLVNGLLGEQKAVVETQSEINEHLRGLSLVGESVESTIDVSGATASDERRLRELLEKLDLRLSTEGEPGLGSNNLLFMACELLLLAQEPGQSKLLLIEEPEAHLHAQRQLRAMQFLQAQAQEKGIQILVTTHSPNLASAIDLNNIVVLKDRAAFSMAEGETQLSASDYRFLQRFLDATKANLFFARGVLIVEGDAENILLPTLARILGRDLTKHGVSIVRVGGVGLRRYARIFQREGVSDEESDKHLKVPVACITDLDVMPDCAPPIVGRVEVGAAWPDREKRRWRTRRDFDSAEALEKHRGEKLAKPSGQSVRTFVADKWTLEYDLACAGLAEDVYIAAQLAKTDEACARKGIGFDASVVAATVQTAETAFNTLQAEAEAMVEQDVANGCTVDEVVAAKVYSEFTRGTKASKAIAAQYLAERLQTRLADESEADVLADQLPEYLVAAIEYVTSGAPRDVTQIAPIGPVDG